MIYILLSLKVEFGECSALGEGKSTENPELSDLYTWINRVA